MSRVRVVSTVIGGAFGKSDALTGEPFAAALALMTQRPVKLRFDRNEDFTGTESHHPSATWLRAGFRPDGGLSSLRARVILDAGAYLSHSPRIAAVLAHQLSDVYPLDDVDITVTVAFTSTPVCGAFRGYGGPQAAFPLEHAIDLGARAVGADPLKARLAALRRAPGDAGDDANHDGADYDRAGQDRAAPDRARASLRECIEAGRQAIGWDRRVAPVGRQHVERLAKCLGPAVRDLVRADHLRVCRALY